MIDLPEKISAGHFVQPDSLRGSFVKYSIAWPDFYDFIGDEWVILLKLDKSDRTARSYLIRVKNPDQELSDELGTGILPSGIWAWDKQVPVTLDDHDVPAGYRYITPFEMGLAMRIAIVRQGEEIVGVGDDFNEALERAEKHLIKTIDESEVTRCDLGYDAPQHGCFAAYEVSKELLKKAEPGVMDYAISDDGVLVPAK